MEEINRDYIELTSGVLNIIYKLATRKIINEFNNKGIEITKTKLVNSLRNWYWGAGIRDISIGDNVVVLYVSRPNKFIGANNFLKELSAEFNKNGFEFVLKKSEPDFFQLVLDEFEKDINI